MFLINILKTFALYMTLYVVLKARENVTNNIIYKMLIDNIINIIACSEFLLTIIHLIFLYLSY